MPWTAAEFEHWLNESNDPVKKERALKDLTREQSKEYREWVVFKRFSAKSGLDIDPRSIGSCKPPEPDIFCEVSGSGQYFEIGEVTDEKLAERAGQAEKANTDVHAGSFSQAEPLEKMLIQKCVKSKTYLLNGLQLSLLLHYTVGHQVPHDEVILHVCAQSRTKEILQQSSFRAIWFYNGWSDSVLHVLREMH